jgi:hypothetical protein
LLNVTNARSVKTSAKKAVSKGKKTAEKKVKKKLQPFRAKK